MARIGTGQHTSGDDMVLQQEEEIRMLLLHHRLTGDSSQELCKIMEMCESEWKQTKMFLLRFSVLKECLFILGRKEERI